ncbi:MAG TPA: lysophospholipid acyltransferase family protein [Planctomycetota bacterium]|nr:lysophospholipid acyltransferase family protein [Planctomycetota bacterium]
MSGRVSRYTPKQELKIRAATAAGLTLYHLLARTYRVRFLDPPYGRRRQLGQRVRCLYSIWHSDIWTMMSAMLGEDVCIMVSEHRDGEFMARIAHRLGWTTVRGSSTRGGARALLELARTGREGQGDMLLTVDGPRGPARVVKEGLVFAASRMRLPVVPVGVAVERAWRLGSWDGHFVGKPFTRVRVAFGAEIRVPPDAGRDDLTGRWLEEVSAGMQLAESRAQAALARQA